MTSYHLLPFCPPPSLPTPTPSPPTSSPSTCQMSSSQYHDYQPQLSLFEQTQREEEERFYSVFPDARTTLANPPQQAPPQPEWRPSFDRRHVFSGTAFHLPNTPQVPDLSRYNYEEPPIPQSSPQSELTYAVDPSSLVHHQPTLYEAKLPQDPYASYTTPQLSPTHPPLQSFASALSIPPQIATSTYADSIHQPHYHQIHHQPPSEPVMDSLPSPGASSDTPSSFNGTPPYYSPPQHAYQLTQPFNGIPSPIHQEPLSPPALVQAAYPHMNAVNPKPEPQQFLPNMQSPPQPDNTIGPSRRRSRDNSSRSQRRHSPPYARTQSSTQRSGGSRGAISIPNPNMGWPTNSPTNTVSSTGGNSHVNGSVSANKNDLASGATQTGNVVSDSASMDVSTSPILTNPGLPSPGKRNPDKKPALACIFCRGRKIACGPPPKDGDGKTCNQCHRRSFRCEYPTESRRGMRKRPSGPSTSSSKASNNSNANGNTKPNTKSESSKTASTKKR